MSALPPPSATPTTSLSVETDGRPRRCTGHGRRGAGRGAAPVTLQSLLADPAFIIGTDAAIGELLAALGRAL